MQKRNHIKTLPKRCAGSQGSGPVQHASAEARCTSLKANCVSTQLKTPRPRRCNCNTPLLCNFSDHPKKVAKDCKGWIRARCARPRPRKPATPCQGARFCSLNQRQAPFQVRMGSMCRELRTIARVVNPPGSAAGNLVHVRLWLPLFLYLCLRECSNREISST